MLNTWKNVKRTSLLLLGSSFLVLVQAAERPSVREGKNPVIAIARINPSEGDIRRIRERQKSEKIVNVGQKDEVHVVKMHLNMPAPSAKAYVLHIGAMKIKEYGGFDEGIFFKAYDRKELDSWAGQPVRFVVDNEIIDLGLNFPSREEIAAIPSPDPTKLPELHEVLKSQ